MFTSLASAEIIIDQQPKEIYNLGDRISVPITIRAINDVSGSFQLDLLCNGNYINFYRNGVSLAYGEEIQINPAPSLVLTQDVIEDSKGFCKIVANLIGEEPVLTNEFKISNQLTIYTEERKTDFNPGENLIIDGNVLKENGQGAGGFIELEIIRGDNSTKSIYKLSTINNGFYSINTSLPKDLEAKFYTVKLKAYEKDPSGEETNIGFTDYSILINQVPNNLEISFENENVEPGTDLKIKTILHDQTGKNIQANSIITIKNSKGKIITQLEKQTDEFLEFPIAYNEKPGQWTIVAVSTKLTSETNFNITEKMKVKIELINKTIFITNTGNIPYCNETVLVKIGNESLNIDVCIDVDDTKKYLLTAPDGEYEIEIRSGGENFLSGSVALTGKAIDFKESSDLIGKITSPVVWIFVLIILGFIAFLLFKKGYKKSFIGKISKKKVTSHKINSKSQDLKSEYSKLAAKSIISSSNNAEVSLSIKGQKQAVSLICLKVKNIKEIQNKKGGAEEIIQKIIDLAEDKKALTYQNLDNIFFIFAPAKTKTFRNEDSAISLSKTIKDILESHNKLFKQKIDFGISLNYGEIVGRQESNVFKFMAMGKLITASKKIASLAKEEILLSDEINTRFGSSVKTSKKIIDKLPVYTITQILDRSKNEKFISNFLSKLEKDKK